MDDVARLQLQKMISANNVEDHTDRIRQLKHSPKLIEDIRTLQKLKLICKNDLVKVHAEAVTQCKFLYDNYTDIYNKVKNDEIDLNLLNQFLNVLQQIEEGKVDQHEGSFMVGTILKELYIDSALKKGDKLDAQHAAEQVKEEPRTPSVNLSWSDFKGSFGKEKTD